MLSPEDREAVLTLERRWIYAEIAGDIQRVRPWLTQDCELCPPNGACATGPDAFLAGLAAPGRITDLILEDVVIAGGGDHAWKTARFRTEMDTGDGLVTIEGRHLWFLRKDAGEWKVRLLSWMIEGE